MADHKEQLQAELTKLKKTVTKRRGELRAFIASTQVDGLLNKDMTDPKTRPQTTQHTITITKKQIQDKLSLHNKSLSQMRVKLNHIKIVDNDMFTQESGYVSQEEEDGEDFNIEVEGVMSRLEGLKVVCQDMIDTSEGLVTFKVQDHNMTLKERDMKLERDREESARKNRELALKEKELEIKEQSTVKEVKHTDYQQIKPPKTELPRFNGDYTEWFSFFDAYNTNVHSRSDWENYTKLTVLRSLLDGAPLKLIKRLPCTNDNYLTAYNTLQSTYGDMEIISASHRSYLESLQPASMDPTSLENVYLEVEQTLQALEALGERVNIEPIFFLGFCGQKLVLSQYTSITLHFHTVLFNGKYTNSSSRFSFNNDSSSCLP